MVTPSPSNNWVFFFFFFFFFQTFFFLLPLRWTSLRRRATCFGQFLLWPAFRATLEIFYNGQFCFVFFAFWVRRRWGFRGGGRGILWSGLLWPGPLFGQVSFGPGFLLARSCKHHQNSTKGPPGEGRKNENCGGREEKSEILGSHSSESHFSRLGPHSSAPFGARRPPGTGRHSTSDNPTSAYPTSAS